MALRLKSVVLLFLPLLLEVGLCPAATFTWTSSTSSDWFNPTNWSPAGVPGTNDTVNFSGGTINFVPQDDKVRFEINMSAAERSGVKISAQLQKLAAAVRRAP